MTTANAPIATAEDRSALSWLINRIRPDWDRKGIESALAKHPCQVLDVLAGQALVAAVTRTDQRTPAVLALDGDHANRARVALGAAPVTPSAPTSSEAGGECAVCGVRRYRHAGLSIRISLDGQPIDEHDWTPAAEPTRADKTTISRAREVAFAHRGETNA